jgi:hypothetical protein
MTVVMLKYQVKSQRDFQPHNATIDGRRCRLVNSRWGSAQPTVASEAA